MSLLDGYEKQDKKRSSLLEGYQPTNKHTSLLEGYQPTQKHSSLLEGYQPVKPKTINTSIKTKPSNEFKSSTSQIIEQYDEKMEQIEKADPETYKKEFDKANNIPQGNPQKKEVFLMDAEGNTYEPSQTPYLAGGIKKNRSYAERFPDRKEGVGGFFHNAGQDVKDTVTGLSQILGQGLYKSAIRPLIRLGKGQTPFDSENVENGLNFLRSGANSLKTLPLLGQKTEEGGNAYFAQFEKDHPELTSVAQALGEGLKENYGQKDIDMFRLENLKEGKNPINVDLQGLGQSLHAHPLNLLDVVGLGEVGKVKQIANLTKGGQVSDFAKTVGNSSLSPKYSENLLINAGQRLAETKPIQELIDYIDNSEKLKPLSDVTADFLGINPDSRLLGKQGAETRLAKVLDQQTQANKTLERNKAFAENKKLFEGLDPLTPEEQKLLIKGIETGNGSAYENMPTTTQQTLKPSKEVKEILEGFKYEKGNLNDYRSSNRYKNAYHSTIIDPLSYDIEQAQRAFNSDVLGDMAKNQERLLKDPSYYAELENKTAGIVKSLPTEAQTDFYNKMVDAYSGVLENGTIIKNIEKTSLNISPEVAEKLKPYRDALKSKIDENAEYYIKKGLLDPQVAHTTPINTYAAHKFNKKIDDLTEAEKLDALKEINKLPDESKPFYIPRMFEEELKASDFFVNPKKRYTPNELKHRGSGINDTNRIFDPLEIVNQLDAHRIRLENTDNLINEVITNFAEPYQGALKEGYIIFNPDTFKTLNKQSLDLNNSTLKNIEETGDIDTALRKTLEETISQSKEQTKEMLDAINQGKVYQIPKSVADTLMHSKGKRSELGILFDMATTGFKRKVLGLSPKWFINNRIGNGIMAGLKGVGLENYIKALNVAEDLLPDELKTKTMYEAEKYLLGRAGTGSGSVSDNVIRLLGGEFMNTDDLKGFAKVGAETANLLGVPAMVINNLVDKMFKFNQKFEDFERRAVYIHNVDKVGRRMFKTTGQNIIKQEELLKEVLQNKDVLNEVLKAVDNTLGDYTNMTAFEKRHLRRIVPFYSWFRTVTRYALSLPESNPFRALIVEKASRVLREENEDLAEYQRGSIPTEFKGENTGKALRLNYEHSNPFSTFGETAESPIGVLNPLIVQAIETASGRRFFGNRLLSSPNYKAINNDFYMDNEGNKVNQLPISERAKALLIGSARNTIPGLEWAEKVGFGLLDNYLKGEGLTPKDALFDTALGGYNYKPSNRWSNQERLYKLLFPLQQERKI